MNDKKKKHSIVTKIGDEGYTYVYSGQKLSKDDLRLEVVGTMDELHSFLGLAKSLVKEEKGKDIIEQVQKDLFIVGSQVSGGQSKKVKKKVSSKQVEYLELQIKDLEQGIQFNNFVLPGANQVSATLHVVRSITRRLERRIVALERKQKAKAAEILVYVNRLSDLLFLLACRYESDD